MEEVADIANETSLISLSVKKTVLIFKEAHRMYRFPKRQRSQVVPAVKASAVLGTGADEAEIRHRTTREYPRPKLGAVMDEVLAHYQRHVHAHGNQRYVRYRLRPGFTDQSLVARLLQIANDRKRSRFSMAKLAISLATIGVAMVVGLYLAGSLIG